MKLFSTFLLTLSTLLFANEGEALFNAKCRVCHGNLADRPAYNASSIIAGWNIEKTIHALQGYKSTQYGGRFKSQKPHFESDSFHSKPFAKALARAVI